MTITTHGTLTLMTTSLLLAVSLTSTAIAEEPTATLTAVPPQSIPVPSPFDSILNSQLSIDFRDAKLVDVLTFMRNASTINMVWPNFTTDRRPLTLKVSNMSASNILAHIERMADLTHTIRNEAYVLQVVDDAGPTATVDLTDLDPAFRDILEQRINFDFKEKSVQDVIELFRQVSGANCVVMPSVASKTETITLTVKNIQLKNALQFICEASRMSVRYANQALIFNSIPSSIK